MINYNLKLIAVFACSEISLLLWRRGAMLVTTLPMPITAITSRKLIIKMQPLNAIGLMWNQAGCGVAGKWGDAIPRNLNSMNAPVINMALRSDATR